jgi:hypothetical protein
MLSASLAILCAGCQLVSDRLSRWKMLGDDALEDPVKAVGGDAIIFAPPDDQRHLSRRQLAPASPEQLVAYYAPVFVQQRVNTQAQKYPYPAEYDMIGEAHLRHDDKGKLESYVAGAPKVYAIFEKLPIEGHEHVQITYTAWYPAHPRMKTIDLEKANIDSCVVRVTLDGENAPLFYETIAACGCFHKVFVERWMEDAAKKTYGEPESGKKFCIERTVKSSIDWEVAGVVEEQQDQPCRPVVFLKAGDHKVLKLGSTAHLRMPPAATIHAYSTTAYSDLQSVPVDGTTEKAAFFDMEDGGKVRGAERKEGFLLSIVGVDSAGQPRANDKIKLHFDESTWSDTKIYARFLRLPQGAL